MSPQLDVFGIVVSDMARSVAFYRLLGLEFPEGAESEPHVEAPLPGGMRYALDTEDTMRAFDPSWKRPSEVTPSVEPSGATRRTRSTRSIATFSPQAHPHTRSRGMRSGASATRSSRIRTGP